MFSTIPSLISKSFPVGGGFDPDAQAFFDAIDTAGGSLTSTEEDAVNQLVLDLKSYFLWDECKAVYPFVGSTSITQKFNLKDPRDLDAAYRLGFFGTWSFSSNGADPNGTNAYANTYYAQNVQPQNDVHISVYNREESTGGRVDMGATNQTQGGKDLQITSNFGGNNFSAANNGAQAAGPVTSSGFVLVTRTISGSFNYFLNNSKTVKGQASDSNISSSNIFIAARNSNGITEYFDNKEKAFASIGNGLDDTEAGNLYNAVVAYQTALSRNV